MIADSLTKDNRKTALRNKVLREASCACHPDEISRDMLDNAAHDPHEFAKAQLNQKFYSAGVVSPTP